jgi:hypothetical protein
MKTQALSYDFKTQAPQISDEVLLKGPRSQSHQRYLLPAALILAAEYVNTEQAFEMLALDREVLLYTQKDMVYGRAELLPLLSQAQQIMSRLFGDFRDSVLTQFESQLSATRRSALEEGRLIGQREAATEALERDIAAQRDASRGSDAGEPASSAGTSTSTM